MLFKKNFAWFFILIFGVVMADVSRDHDAIFSIKKRIEINRSTKFNVDDLISPYLKVGSSLDEVRSLCAAMKMGFQILPRTQAQAASREVLWCSRLLSSTASFGGAHEIRIVTNLDDGYVVNYSATVFYKSL